MMDRSPSITEEVFVLIFLRSLWINGSPRCMFMVKFVLRYSTLFKVIYFCWEAYKSSSSFSGSCLSSLNSTIGNESEGERIETGIFFWRLYR